MDRRWFPWHRNSSSEKAESTESGKNPSWKEYAKLPLEEKRKLYKCGGDFVTLKNIPTWPEYREENLYAIYKKKGKKTESFKPQYSVKPKINEKISLWQGDITKLEIDAIVNAANNSLLGGGGVDGCIHRAAGSTLRQECHTLHGCATGDAKLTSGHKLPATYIIHTVGPIGKQEKALRNCYKMCLKLVKEHSIRSVAFCCISTGIYGYPLYDASCVALNSVRKWLEDEENADSVDRIIFCVFLGGDLDVYQSLIPKYFPSGDKYDQSREDEEDENCEMEVKKTDEDEGKTKRNEELGTQEGKDADNAETDEDEIKKGIPEPPLLEELLEEGSTKEVVNKNIPTVDETSTSEGVTPLDADAKVGALASNSTEEGTLSDNSMEEGALPGNSMEKEALHGNSMEKGALPDNSMEETALPGNSKEKGVLPGNSMEEGALPGNSMEEGALPGNSMEKGGLPGNSLEEGASPDNSMEEGALPGNSMEKGALPGNSMEKGTLSDNAMEKGALSDNSMEETALPGNSKEKGALPGNSKEKRVLPGNSMEEGALPGDSSEKGALPGNSSL